MTIREELYLGDYKTREDLEDAIRALGAPDATRIQSLGDCPRKAQYSIERGITKKGESYPKVAGMALHAGLAVYYTTFDDELSLQAVRDSWGEHGTPPSTSSYAHLTLGHIEVVFKRYLMWAKKSDMFKPIVAHMDDLELKHVKAAIWRMTDDGRVVLGESKIVMEFSVAGEQFVYSGIPDLPIEMGGAFYILDHKSTNAYLSEYWAEQHRHSNQLRGYCAMIERLTGLRISGALINSIYMGAKASSSEYKGNRFARFGPYMYTPGHYSEAIQNQWAWRKTLDVWKQLGYYPQHASRLCSGCEFTKLCGESPTMRESIIDTDFVDRNFSFLKI